MLKRTAIAVGCLAALAALTAGCLEIIFLSLYPEVEEL